MVYINVWEQHTKNGPIILEKAREFPDAFDCKDFQASNGWLRGWTESWIVPFFEY